METLNLACHPALHSQFTESSVVTVWQVLRARGFMRNPVVRVLNLFTVARPCSMNVRYGRWLQISG
jgi:hypothetical protein